MLRRQLLIFTMMSEPA